MLLLPNRIGDEYSPNIHHVKVNPNKLIDQSRPSFLNLVVPQCALHLPSFVATSNLFYKVACTTRTHKYVKKA